MIFDPPSPLMSDFYLQTSNFLASFQTPPLPSKIGHHLWTLPRWKRGNEGGIFLVCQVKKSVVEKNFLKLNKSAKLLFGTLEYLQKHLCRRNLLSCDLHYAHKFDIVKGRLKVAKSNLPIFNSFVHCAILEFLPLMPLQKICKSCLRNSTTLQMFTDKQQMN